MCVKWKWWESWLSEESSGKIVVYLIHLFCWENLASKIKWLYVAFTELKCIYAPSVAYEFARDIRHKLVSWDTNLHCMCSVRSISVSVPCYLCNLIMPSALLWNHAPPLLYFQTPPPHTSIVHSALYAQNDPWNSIKFCGQSASANSSDIVSGYCTIASAVL